MCCRLPLVSEYATRWQPRPSCHAAGHDRLWLASKAADRTQPPAHVEHCRAAYARRGPSNTEPAEDLCGLLSVPSWQSHLPGCPPCCPRCPLPSPQQSLRLSPRASPQQLPQPCCRPWPPPCARRCYPRQCPLCHPQVSRSAGLETWSTSTSWPCLLSRSQLRLSQYMQSFSRPRLLTRQSLVCARLCTVLPTVPPTLPPTRAPTTAPSVGPSPRPTQMPTDTSQPSRRHGSRVLVACLTCATDMMMSQFCPR